MSPSLPFPPRPHTLCQILCLPFLAAVNPVIKTKQRAFAAPPYCQTSAATCLQHPPHPPPFSRESPGRRIPLNKLWSCNPLGWAEWQADCRGENKEWWREREDERCFFFFVPWSLSLSVTASLSLSISLAHLLSVYRSRSLIGMQSQACSVLQCGFWEHCCMSGRDGNRTAVAVGVSTHIHTPLPYAHTSIKPLPCCTRKPVSDWLCQVSKWKVFTYRTELLHVSVRCSFSSIHMNKGLIVAVSSPSAADEGIRCSWKFSVLNH